MRNHNYKRIFLKLGNVRQIIQQNCTIFIKIGGKVILHNFVVVFHQQRKFNLKNCKTLVKHVRNIFLKLIRFHTLQLMKKF